MTQRVFGIIPARMAASRFPGKPLVEICGKSMIRHVAETTIKFSDWNSVYVATCDDEIVEHLKGDYKISLTSPRHTRALDRVAEAFVNECAEPKEDDIIVCVQGDEPLLDVDMIAATINPIKNNSDIRATVLAMPIIDPKLWENPDTVKLLFNDDGKVLYTSRVPVPYAKNGFTSNLGAYRIVGVFAFEWAALKEFTEAPESRLEQLEACDSNRIFELSFDQYVARIDYRECYSVDSPEDILLVEKVLKKNLGQRNV